MIIAIDFDGTIVEHMYPGIGPLRPGATRVINRLRDAGHTIIIWTCRYSPEDLADMKKFLTDQGIRYDHVNENPPWLNFQPHPKVYADVYIDDHNLFGTWSWLAIEDELNRRGAFDGTSSELSDHKDMRRMNHE